MKQKIVLAAALVLLAGSPAWAQNGWAGNVLTGSLNFGGGDDNYFDPENNLVPSNSSGIQPVGVVSDDDDDFVEFSALDEVSDFAWDVDVDAGTVTVEQSTLGAPLGTGDWDIYLSGFNPNLADVSLVSNTFPELFWAVEDGGDTLHLAYPGGNILPPEGWRAQFSLDGAVGPGGVIPAPEAVLLGGLGAGLVGWLRRRRAL